MPGSVTSFLLTQNKARFLADKSKDTVWLRNRRRFVDAIQKDALLMNREKLRLSEPLLSGHIWNVFSEEVAVINERFLSNQIEIEIGTPGEMLTKARLIETVEQWVLQHEDDLVSRSLSRLGDQICIGGQTARSEK